MTHARDIGCARLQQVGPAGYRVQRRAQVVIEAAHQCNEQVGAIRRQRLAQPARAGGAIPGRGFDLHRLDYAPRNLSDADRFGGKRTHTRQVTQYGNDSCQFLHPASCDVSEETAASRGESMSDDNEGNRRVPDPPKDDLHHPAKKPTAKKPVEKDVTEADDARDDQHAASERDTMTPGGPREPVRKSYRERARADRMEA